MESSVPQDLHKNLVDAACSILEHFNAKEHTILEGLEGGNRLSIEIAILPPAEQFKEGAMRTPPLTQRIIKRQ